MFSNYAFGLLKDAGGFISDVVSSLEVSCFAVTNPVLPVNE